MIDEIRRRVGATEARAEAAGILPFIMRIEGPVPSKKNRPMGNGFSISRDMHGKLNDLMWQMKSAWVGRAAVSRPHMKFELFMPNANADSDNAVTTLLDCLVKSGVLVNDNLTHLGRYEVVADLATASACLITVTGGVPMQRVDKVWKAV